MRGVTKLLLAGVLALLLAVGVAACGGDDSSDSTAASTAATTERSAPPRPTEDNGSAKQEQEKAKESGDDRGGSDGAPDDSGAGSGDSRSEDGPTDSKPSRKSGDSASSPQQGSASFRTPGGDNSIQDFGEEADDAEREAASVVVLGFMRARAKGNWAGVCTYLAATTLKPLEELTARSPQFKGKSCGELLETVTGNLPASARASNISGGIDSLRVEGERGFALYHGTDGKDYFLPLVKEDGEWKVGATAPSEIPGS